MSGFTCINACYINNSLHDSIIKQVVTTYPKSLSQNYNSLVNYTDITPIYKTIIIKRDEFKNWWYYQPIPSLVKTDQNVIGTINALMNGGKNVTYEFLVNPITKNENNIIVDTVIFSGTNNGTHINIMYVHVIGISYNIQQYSQEWISCCSCELAGCNTWYPGIDCTGCWNYNNRYYTKNEVTNIVSGLLYNIRAKLYFGNYDKFVCGKNIVKLFENNKQSEFDKTYGVKTWKQWYDICCEDCDGCWKNLNLHKDMIGKDVCKLMS